jgi:hypothetical protein
MLAVVEPGDAGNVFLDTAEALLKVNVASTNSANPTRAKRKSITAAPMPNRLENADRRRLGDRPRALS